MEQPRREVGGESNGNGSAASPSSTRKRKSVQIAEDRNETRVFLRPPNLLNPASNGDGAASLAGASLLEEAEQKQTGHKLVSLTIAGAKAASVALSRAVQVNELQRAKGGTNAETYLESEVALYEQIAALKAFAAADNVQLMYPALHDATSDLIQLLLHDNVDIAIAVTSVLLEWLDLDLVTRPPIDSVEPVQLPHINEAVIQMAARIVADGAELLVDNLGRQSQTLDDEDEDDAENEVGRGVDDILSLFENLLEMDNLVLATRQTTVLTDVSMAAALCRSTRLVPWILTQLQEQEGPYRTRCMELISYLTPKDDVHSFVSDWSRIPLYTSPFDDTETKPKQSSNGDASDEPCLDGIEIVLQCVADFRKRQPTADEVEFLENGCMVMASLLTFSPLAVQTFLSAQGVEFVIRCLKERVYAGALALKWLDFTGAHDVYQRASEHVVSAGALKYIFPLFMGQSLPRYHTKAVTAKQTRDVREYRSTVERTTIRVLYSLIRHLRDDSPNDAKERVLAKFIDQESSTNPKVTHLVHLIVTYDQRARLAEYKFFRSDVEDDLDDSMIALAALEAKLAAGGDLVHRLAAMVAFCCVASQQCHGQILAALHAKESGIGLIHAALEEFSSVLEASEQKTQIESYLGQI